jgi:hypothetical protein
MRTISTINVSQGIILASFILLASIGFGCASSNLTNVWKDPGFKNSPMSNMLIIAASRSPVNRRIWEDEIAAELSAHKVTTTQSYRLFPDSIPDPDQLASVVREKRFDGILFIRKLQDEISTKYTQPSVTQEMVTRYSERDNAYHTYYRDVQQPGYTDTSKVVRHDVSVFTTQEGSRLVWAGTGEMIDPTSREAVRGEIVGLVVPELARQGMIPAK